MNMKTNLNKKSHLSSFTKKSGRSKSYDLSSSTFFQAPAKRVDVHCVVSNLGVQQFKYFLNGIAKIHNFSTSSGNVIHSLIHLINLFVGINLIHSSSFVDTFVSRGRDLCIPQFLHPIIAKVGTRVNSKNNTGSWVHGELRKLGDTRTLLLAFSSLTQDELKVVLSNTPFSRVAYDARLYEQFVSEFDNLYDLEDPDIDFSVLRHLELISETVHSKTNPINMYIGKLASTTSVILGIYRFRNYEDGVFLANGTSCSSVTLESLNFFACFLKLFEPTFKYPDGTILPMCFLPGDMMVSVKELDFVDAWECYLSFQFDKSKLKTIDPELSVISSPRKTKAESDGTGFEGGNTLTLSSRYGMVSRLAGATPVFYVSDVASKGQYYYLFDPDEVQHVA